ncbi:MAG: lactate utilization protein [Oscillospiraceae bacterium]|nr:lactate utilization protein [Oscillospiraceae bacterium]
MDQNTKTIIEKRIERTMKALENNNMQAFYAENKCKAVELVKGLIEKGSTVSFGGSVSLSESGVIELIKNGDYNLLDRSAPGLTPEQIQKIYRDTFSADVYLCSSNAITENGELYNVDGFGNRVAAITFGPESVIIVAGYNKIVADIDEAADRVKRIAAPANCLRLSKDTYCAACGSCVSLKDGKAEMTEGCNSEDRICRSYVVTSKQKIKNRIKVILVGEELGY